MINGILSAEDVQALENNNLKMLILGYKHLRRGDDFYNSHREDIEEKQKWLYENLPDVIDKFTGKNETLEDIVDDLEK